MNLSGTAFLGGGTLSYAHLSPADQNNGDPFGTAWSGFTNLDGFSRKERIRYDTPSIAGLSLSASYQSNDDVDAGLRFTHTGDVFKLHARAGVLA